MKRPSKQNVSNPASYPARDDSLLSSFPLLQEHLVDDVWEDGSARVTSTLFLFWEAGRVKCMFKDRETGLLAFYTAHTVVALFECIEENLKNDTVDWKRDRKAPGRGR